MLALTFHMFLSFSMSSWLLIKVRSLLSKSCTGEAALKAKLACWNCLLAAIWLELETTDKGCICCFSTCGPGLDVIASLLRKCFSWLLL